MGVVELEAAAALYGAALLEELGPFAIADRIAELWLQGGLPTGATTRASRALDDLWLQRDARLTAHERRALYARVFDAGFDDAWAALLDALAAERAGRAVPASELERRAELVRALLTARIDEATLAVTPALHEQLSAVLDVLGDREVLEMHGARDLWHLLEQRARLDLGTEPDAARTRTMAAAGTAVIAWLADDAAPGEDVRDAARSWLSAAARA